MARVETAGSSRNGGRVVGIRVHDDDADPTITGSASSAILIEGSATGTALPPAVTGVASSGIVILGDAAGTVDAPGSVTGSASSEIVVTGSATGTAVPPAITGTASGEIAVTGSATGQLVETHVFVLIGQSNMVGRGTYDGLGDYPAGVLQWGQSTETLTPAVSPLDHWNEQPDTMGLSLQFITEYAAANPGVQIVVAPMAEGGTGFYQGDWIVPSGPNYTWAVSSLNNLFAQYPAFQLKGFLWHQGEGDVANGSGAYAANLDALIDALRTNVTAASASTPFICGGLTSGTADRSVINTILSQTPDRRPYTAFAVGNNLTLFDGTHFDAASLRTLGSRYFAQLDDAVGNVPRAPNQVTGLTAVPGDGQVALSWTAPLSHSAITDYLIEVNIGGAGWTTVADGVGTGTSFTHTGRTNGVSHSYRVSAISANGTGAASATASATPVASPTVTVLQFSSSQSSADAASYTFSNMPTAPGTIIVAFATSGGTGGGLNAAPTSVTCGGSAMTKIGEQRYEDADGSAGEENRKISFWRISGQTGTSKTIVATLNATSLRAGIAVWSLGDANAAGAVFNGFADIGTLAISETIDAPARGAVLAYCFQFGNPPEGTWTGIDNVRLPATAVDGSNPAHLAGDKLFPSAVTGHAVGINYALSMGSILGLVAVPPTP
jgi:hypothetical protein